MAYINENAFDIFNSDIMEHMIRNGKEVSPSELKVGDVVVLRKQVKCASFGWNSRRNPVAKAGSYRVVNRTHFRGGYTSFFKA